MCLLNIGFLACHIIGISSPIEHGRLDLRGDDRFALEQHFVQHRPVHCRDRGFNNGDANDCDEPTDRY